MKINSYTGDLFWRIRSHLMAPSILLTQKILGNSIQGIIDNHLHDNIGELSEKFQGKTLAIVGNSGNILGQKMGNKIDSHDYVLRFNRGIDPDFLNVSDTGIKTNLWSTGTLDTLMYQNVDNINLNALDLLIPFPFTDSEYKNVGINIGLLNVLKSFKNRTKYYMDQGFYDGLYSKLGNEPSSGFVFINYFLLKTEIENISLYGFDFSTKNRITGETYGKQHDFNKEKSIVLDLIDNNSHKIQLY